MVLFRLTKKYSQEILTVIMNLDKWMPLNTSVIVM